MSNIYIQEPPTHGKVLLVTSVGHIDIELWSKEAPKACRNFVQLCMEGYYDGTIFHRVVKDFIVQGGDPTGTGEGGESIYGNPFKDEFHSRLRFTRRGLVAMANAGPNDNSSQFFFTLAAAPELNNKHTIFGKITGNTVYNMLKLAESDIGADDRPVFPCQINSTEILSNPYNDIIPRENLRAKKDDKGDKKSKSKSKATKNFSLLSFGEEAEEDEEEVNKVTKDIRVKSKSSHDLSDDPQLSSVPAIETEERESIKRPASGSDEENIEQKISPGKEAAVKEVRKKLKKEDDNKKSKTESLKREEKEEEPAKISRSEELRQEAKKLKKEIKDSRKKDDQVKKPDDTKDEKVTEEPVNDAIAAYRKERQKYKDLRKDQKKKGSDREKATMQLLEKFQTKLNSARLLSSNYSEDEEKPKDTNEEKEESDEDPSDMSWMRHKLEFDEKLHRVLDANITDVDRYEVSDPRNPLTQRRREASKKSSKSKR